MKKLFLIAFVMLSFSTAAYGQVSYPHPAGSTFAPVTATPTLPVVNSTAAQAAETATSQENAAAESAVTQTQNQVNQTLNNQQTQQDLNAKTGTDTTSQVIQNTNK